MLEFQSVTGLKNCCLKDVSFHMEEGYLMGIVGKNGAGKSTLFRTMLESNVKYEGTVLYKGMDIKKNREAFLQDVGYVADENHFVMSKSARENADLLGPFYPRREKGYFYEQLKKFEISAKIPLKDLSRGEFIKFQLAFAMGHYAKLYLLDEATAGMDPVFRLDFFNILREILTKGDALVLLSTQLQSDLHKNADYIGVMDNGQMISFKENLA